MQVVTEEINKLQKVVKLVKTGTLKHQMQFLQIKFQQHMEQMGHTIFAEILLLKLKQHQQFGAILQILQLHQNNVTLLLNLSH